MRWISQFLFLLLFAFRFSAYAESLPDWKRTNPFAEKDESQAASFHSNPSPNSGRFQHPDVGSEVLSPDENSESEEDENHHDQQPDFSGNASQPRYTICRKFFQTTTLQIQGSQAVAKAGTCPLFLLHRNIRL